MEDDKSRTQDCQSVERRLIARRTCTARQASSVIAGVPRGVINPLMRHGGVENRPLLSQVFWFKTCHLGEASQHTRTDLVAIMKSEDDIGPPSPL